MKLFAISILFLLLTMQPASAQLPVLETGSQQPMPAEWIDKDTGHKVSRIAGDNGSFRSFYFHNNPFLKARNGQDDLMVCYGEVDDSWQLFSLSLATLEIRQLTSHPSRISGEIVADQLREVLYQANDTVFATHIDTRATRTIYVFPEAFKAHITTLNADETKLAGTWAAPEKREIYEKHPSKGEYFNRIFEAHIPHTLFTIDLQTGALEKIHSEDTWLGHIQFSTADPDILMFCHEGPWHLVDRIWNINTSTGEVQKIHERTVHREIAGHEFWSWDGKTIWYDLQIPRGETFYLAGHNIETGRNQKYQMTRDEWSIHFNISPDQTLFCGDGGDPSQVARAEDGMWLYLFTPEGDKLSSRRLVNMQHHDYKLEPNVHFSPDGTSVIFRANFEGESKIYAVELQIDE